MKTTIAASGIENAVKEVFREEVYHTGLTEYGVSWQGLASGEEQVPPQGARFDIYFEGTVKGDGISGKVKGVDYLIVRADGKFQLRIFASILTDDGEIIALEEDGIMTLPEPGTAGLYLNMRFSTTAPQYQWLNQKQVWGIGSVDMAAGKIDITGYANPE